MVASGVWSARRRERNNERAGEPAGGGVRARPRPINAGQVGAGGDGVTQVRFAPATRRVKLSGEVGEADYCGGHHAGGSNAQP
jgi:hypothetical protein